MGVSVLIKPRLIQNDKQSGTYTPSEYWDLGLHRVDLTNLIFTVIIKKNIKENSDQIRNNSGDGNGMD